jgi:hypothetical protein
MAYYCARGWPWTRYAAFTPEATQSCSDVMRRAQEHVGFGPWIAFKIADMAERVMGVPVSFTDAEVFVFKDPAKAAVMTWLVWHPELTQPIADAPGVEPNNVAAGPAARAALLREVVSRLTHEFRDLPAPPGWDRPVALNEIETVLCKWKAHINGHLADRQYTEVPYDQLKEVL